MQIQSIDDIKAKIPELLEQVPYLKLLILFGSRARGDHDESSDWDFAMLFDEELRKQYEEKGWDCYRSWTILQNLLDLSDDGMDWVDLKDASELLSHSITRDAVVLYESEPDCFSNFRQQHLLDRQQLKIIRNQQNIELEAALMELGA